MTLGLQIHYFLLFNVLPGALSLTPSFTMRDSVMIEMSSLQLRFPGLFTNYLYLPLIVLKLVIFNLLFLNFIAAQEFVHSVKNYEIFGQFAFLKFMLFALF